MSKCHETNATKNTKKIPTEIPKNTQKDKCHVWCLLNCLEATLGDYYRLTLECLTHVVVAVVVAASSAYAVRVAGTQGATQELPQQRGRGQRCSQGQLRL